MTTNENFRLWLTEEIAQRGLTISELARLGNMHPATLTNILNGERGVGVTSARQIARALGLPEIYVMQKAGLLSETISQGDRPLIIQIAELARDLPDDELREILALLHAKREKLRKVQQQRASI